MIAGSIDLNLLSSDKYEIGKSLRFRASNSARLTRTPASAGNRKTWTWSAWVKRGLLSSAQALFEANSGADYFRFDSSDRLELYFNSVSALVTTPVYRDPSGWYHIVLAVDTTQATSTNRIKIYINNEQITSFASSSYPAQNTDGAFNNTVAHTIGAQNTSNYFDGYMADINLIDGQALTPASLGKTDSITGSWIPKKFYGNYGTNGFFLNFKDATSTTTIGYDYSGKNNNFTTSGISVTSGSTFDQMLDTPSNNYGVMNPIDVTASTIADGNLKVTQVFGVGAMVTGTIGMTSGKWYWEVTPSGGGIGVIGIQIYGTANFQSPYGNRYYPGYEDSSGIGYLASGTVYRTGGIIQTYNSFTTNDVIGIALDMDNGKVFFSKNGTWQGSADPAAGTNPTASTGITGNIWCAASGDNTNIATITHNYNFGQRAFVYTPPTGFKALNSQNLPTPTITKASNYIEDIAYTGGSDTYWNSISAGLSHVVAIKPDGTLWSWGNNTSGQLGQGDTTSRSSPTIIGSLSWSQVSGGGGSHILGIRNDGTLWAWGSNNAGQLGLGNTTSRSSPVQVSASSWTQVSAGALHSLAILSDGTLWAWGFNTSGQLGLNDITNRSSPVLVSASSWTQVSAGSIHSLAIRLDGTLWAWGSNGAGRLGVGDTTNRSVPSQVGTSSWISVSAGEVHSAGIRLGGSLFTWGDNTNGRLGDNTTNSTSTPALIGSSSWTAVDVYGFSSAIRVGGSLFTWGTNTSGQLGQGDLTNRSSPTLVGTSSWVATGVGASHLIALRNGGNLFSVGLNTSGQLGDLTTTNRSSPVLLGSKTITTGFNTNLVWIKDRANAVDHAFYDSVRGAGLRLETNNTDAETTADNLLTSFSTAGAVVQAAADQVNIEGRSYISWNWLEGATPGFDIVTYAGDNTSNRNISHSLGVAPSFVIVKSRSSSNWWVWHTRLTGNTYFIPLNNTNAQTLTNTPWGTGNWSSSQFMVTNNATENANATSTNYVAYLWSEVAGFSRFGSYTGNGSTNGTVVWCGFRPKFVMTKRADSTGNWMILDSVRPGYNLTDYVVTAESSAQENTIGGLNRIDLLSNGFKLRDSSAVNNALYGTYIFAAFAETPFKYARAR